MWQAEPHCKNSPSWGAHLLDGLQDSTLAAPVLATDEVDMGPRKSTSRDECSF